MISSVRPTNPLPFDQAPLIKALFPFIAGVSAYILIDAPVQPLLRLPVVLALSAALLFLILLRKKKQLFLRTVTFNLFFILAGYAVCLSSDDRMQQSHYLNAGSNTKTFLAIVDEPVQEKVKTVKTFVRLQYSVVKWETQKTTGKVLCYLEKDERSLSLKVGDAVLLRGNLQPIPGALNPGEFDYARYLGNKEVYRQIYGSRNDWSLSKQNSVRSVFSLAESARNRLLSLLLEAGLKGDEYAVAAALLLGHTADLSQDLKNSYSDTGTIHILAVSGMHVGLIYLLTGYLLIFLPSGRRMDFLKLVIMVLLIWTYSLITGFTPSILRAATMFTFIAGGKYFFRHASIYNVLAASCLLLLLVNPYSITDAGFQLSYFAVLGIVILQPFMERFLPEHRILKPALALVCISLAAQLFTFPLSLYYFHRFPNYFLLSNLAAVPLSTIAIYAGILLFIISPIKAAASILASGIAYLIHFLNEITRAIGSAPHGISGNVWLQMSEVIFIYLMILVCLLAIVLHSKKLMFSAFAVAIGLLLFQVAEQYHEFRQDQLVVLYHKDASIIAALKGKTMTYVINRSQSDAALSCSRSGLEAYYGVTSRNLREVEGNHIIKSRRKAIITLQKPFKKPFPDDCPFLLTSETLLPHEASGMAGKRVILDGTLTNQSRRRLLKLLKEREVVVYDLKEKGACFLNNIK